MSKSWSSKQPQSIEPFFTLPDDVLIDIFLRLPTKSLIKLRYVCKSWRSFLSNSNFVRLQLTQSIQKSNPYRVFLNFKYSYYKSSSYHQKYPRWLKSLDYEQSYALCSGLKPVDAVAQVGDDFNLPVSETSRRFDLLGSCDGLLLIQIQSDELLCLWNPSTGDFRKIPKSGAKLSNPDDGEECLAVGLGYDSSIDDYKVVRVSKSRYGSDRKFEVFNLSGNAWRVIEEKSNCFFGYGRNPIGVYYNGGLYWLVGGCVLVFILGGERIGKLAIPSGFHFEELCVLGGSLAMICRKKNTENCTEIWMMDGKGGEDTNWTVSIVIPHSIGSKTLFSPIPMSILRNGDVMIRDLDRELFVYDRRNNVVNYIVNQRSDKNVEFKAVVYVRSLVNPNIVCSNDSCKEQKAVGKILEKLKSIKMDDKYKIVKNRLGRLFFPTTS
ncbi:F-box domain [Dillenia turbinata]|uniref:F-box domain n=1 Tax=Dillenia turbinata TaxID=194707 RepID=A0AAN8ULT8_9MAGN